VEFRRTRIPDVVLMVPRVFADDRGFFMETYQQPSFLANGIGEHFVQDNHSMSRRLTLRGLHYQIRRPQGKLVRVVAGEVFDVCVDLRRSSPTFGEWEGTSLSARNMYQLWVPPGFAHGFLAISDRAEVIYKVTDLYAPEHERTLLWDDPDIKIEWPLQEGQVPLLSEKDAGGKRLREAEVYG